MSSAGLKPPLKDPTRPPLADEIDRHLGPFSRYVRTVRGTARIAGLSCRLVWMSGGWVESLKLDDAVIASIGLARVPPVASIGVSKPLEAALLARQPSERFRAALLGAPGTLVRWIEVPLTGLENADLASLFVTLKTDLLRGGQVPLSLAERSRQSSRPHESPAPHSSRRAAKAKPRPPAKAKPAGAKAKDQALKAKRRTVAKAAKIKARPSKAARAKKPKRAAARQGKRR